MHVFTYFCHPFIFFLGERKLESSTKEVINVEEGIIALHSLFLNGYKLLAYKG